MFLSSQTQSSLYRALYVRNTDLGCCADVLGHDPHLKLTLQ